MSLRLLALAFGLAELAAPKQFVDYWMRLASDPDSDVELRPWVYTAARVEGVLLVLWALTRRRGEKA